ncbi:hypothetical protein AMJ80_00590 [bacterium SM23_31]|nr:MAG: hypothetical protein AMJ80_00590 [bacterium SM23_31]
MNNIWAILQRELRSYFVSPLAYGIIVGFLIVTGFMFYISLGYFLTMVNSTIMEANIYRTPPPPVNVNESVISPVFRSISFISLLLLAMITMRLFAEEKKMMTIELLFTSPVTTFQMIMGKYLAGLALYVIMLIPTSVYCIILFIFGEPEILPIFTGYLGLLLIGAVLISIGLLVSSFTENQLIAVALSLSIFLLLWMIDWPADIIGQPAISSLLTYISLPSHFYDFTNGVLDSKHILYYLSIIVLSFYLTQRSLESMRWRS